MTEKTQHTAAAMRETMHHRYDDGLHHKHDKCHLPYRLHWPTHPANTAQLANGLEQSRAANASTGTIREKNLKKIRLRIVKHRVH